MKIFITNKDVFDSVFNYEASKEYKDSKQIHQALFNKIKTDISVNNMIEINVMIPYSDIYDGDACFEFIGKNKDMIFYSFNGTVK